MGGKKKRSIKQTERAQRKKAPSKKEKKAAPPEKKSIPGITPPNVKGDKFTGELKKMKVITPFTVASRFELRLSVARQLLKDLERQGLIQFVSRSRNLQIYKPAS